MESIREEEQAEKERIQREIAERLSDFVMKNFKSNKELAEKTGILESTLSYYVNGKRELNPRVLVKLASVGCNVGWLLTGKESQKTINNESPINGQGNAVSNLQGQNKVLNKIAVGEAAELEILREKAKLLEDKAKLWEDKAKFLEDIITDLRKQNNLLLNKITGGEK